MGSVRGLVPGALAVLALFPVVCIGLASVHGPGMSPDSVGYAVAARTFAGTGQFLYWDGSPYVLWPPGLPLLLGMLVRAGLDLQVAAVAINAAASAATVALTCALGRPYLGSWRAALVPAALVAVSLAIIKVGQMLWTEPVFFVMVLGSMILMVRIQRSGLRASTLLSLVFLVAAASAVRFIGVSLIPLTVVTVASATLRSGRLRAFTLTILSGVLSSAGVAIVVARNLSLGADAFGPRSTSTYSIRAAFIDIAATLGQVMAPAAQHRVALAIGACVAGLAAVGLVAVLRDRTIPRLQALLIPAFIAIYLLLLVASELTTNINGVNARYLSPVLAPLAVLVALGARALWRELPAPRFPPAVRRGGTLALRGALTAAALAFAFLNIRGDIDYVQRVSAAGTGYNRTKILDSPLAAAVGRLPPGAGILTNEPVEVYWVTGRFPVLGTTAFGLPRAVDDLRAAIALGAPPYFAEFTVEGTTQGVSAQQILEAGFSLTPLQAYADGALFVVGSDGPGS